MQDTQDMQSKIDIGINDVSNYIQQDFGFYCGYIDPDYIATDFHNEIQKKLQLVAEGKLKRLVVCLPPGAGKSRLVTQLFPSWILNNDPKKKIMVAGYGQDLPNYFSEQTRKLMKSELNITDIDLDNDAVKHRELAQGGFYHATSVGGAVTGFRFDIGIIDDPIKSQADADSMVIRQKVNDWYTSTFYTRRLTSDSAIIIVLTRWHVKDIIGFLNENSSEKWDSVIVPAIQEVSNDGYNKTYKSFRPERYPLEDLQHTKSLLPLRQWEALYMQNPIASTGNIFKPPFKYAEYTELFEGHQAYKKEDIQVGIYVDPAFSTDAKSDDAVIIAGGIHRITKDLFHLDGYAGTVAPSITIENILMMADKWRIYGFTNIYISVESVKLNRDQGKFLKDLYDAMKMRGVQYPIFEYKPQMGKYDRIRFFLEPVYANKSLTLVKAGGDTQVMRKLEEQLTTFPNGDHDDVIDCQAQFVDVARKKAMHEDPNKRLPKDREYVDKITGEVRGGGIRPRGNERF